MDELSFTSPIGDDADDDVVDGDSQSRLHVLTLSVSLSHWSELWAAVVVLVGAK